MMKPIAPPRPAAPGCRPALTWTLALMMAGALIVPAEAAAPLPLQDSSGHTAGQTAGHDAPARPDGVAASARPPEASRGPARPMHLAQAAPNPATVQSDAAVGGDPARLPSEDDALPPNAEAIMRSPRFRQLAHELRCLVCQNQTLLDSHAPLAQDLRHEVVRLVASGMDDAQVKQYLVDRYGEFVLYRPSWSWRNAVLWLGPALMLLLAGGVAWRILAQRKRALAAATRPTAPDGKAPRAPQPVTTAEYAASVGAEAATDHRDDASMAAPTGPTADTEARAQAHDALRQVDALLARGAQGPQRPDRSTPPDRSAPGIHGNV